MRSVNLKKHNTSEEWEEDKIELLIITNESFELLLGELRSKNQFSLLLWLSLLLYIPKASYFG